MSGRAWEKRLRMALPQRAIPLAALLLVGSAVVCPGGGIAQEVEADSPVQDSGASEGAVGRSPHGAQGGSPHGAQGGSPHGSLQAPRTVVVLADGEVPAGSIVVQVVQADGSPVAGERVRLGGLDRGQSMEPRYTSTDGDGRASFDDLPPSPTRAYRLSIEVEGARYGSAPFTLAADRGARARIIRWPVTRSDGRVLQAVGQTIVEFKPDGRLHLIQQMQLMNIGNATYLFPEDGLAIALPAEATAVEAPAIMGDQRVLPEADQGIRLHGSLPPGPVNLSWSYDLRPSGSQYSIRVINPFRTVTYRVVVQGGQGLSFEASGMPPTRPITFEGRNYLFTELRRSPGDAPFDELRITLDGVPGPSPMRYGAVVLGVLCFLLTLVLGFRSGAGSAELAEDSGELDELLLRGAELERDRAAGEIGPEYCQSQREAIVRRVAELLREKSLLRGGELSKEG